MVLSSAKSSLQIKRDVPQSTHSGQVMFSPLGSSSELITVLGTSQPAGRKPYKNVREESYSMEFSQFESSNVGKFQSCGTSREKVMHPVNGGTPSWMQPGGIFSELFRSAAA